MIMPKCVPKELSFLYAAFGDRAHQNLGDNSSSRRHFDSGILKNVNVGFGSPFNMENNRIRRSAVKAGEGQKQGPDTRKSEASSTSGRV